MKIAAFVLSALLALLQTPAITRMNDRELEGLKGPAKKVSEESSEIGQGSGKTNPPVIIAPPQAYGGTAQASGAETNYPDLATRAICRDQTLVYDQQGRLTSRSVYPGVRCEEEIKYTYSYDSEGNRHEQHDASRASTIQFGPPPPATSAGSVYKRTFEGDDQGRLVVTDFLYSSAGRLVDAYVKIYDSQNRLLESQAFDADKRITGKVTFTYKENDPFPASSASFGGDGKPYSRATYSDYKLNARGDWIRRTEIREQSGRSAFSIQQGSPGRTVSRSARLIYRTINYY
jgi:YD repeat-containing protein